MKNNVPYYIKIQGCVVSLMSKNSGANVLKRLLVNPIWIDLWNDVLEGKFELSQWNRLSAIEKNFMITLANAMKIDNRYLHSANNNEAASSIERLKLLEGAILSGNINKEILDEANAIITDLNNRQMLYTRTANALKKRFSKAYEQTQESFNQVSSLRRRV